MLDYLSQAEVEKRKIIYLDEIMFTKRTWLDKAYSHKFTNLAVNQEDIYTGYRSVIAALSEEKGVEHLFIDIRPIKEE